MMTLILLDYHIPDPWSFLISAALIPWLWRPSKSMKKSEFSSSDMAEASPDICTLDILD